MSLWELALEDRQIASITKQKLLLSLVADVAVGGKKTAGSLDHRWKSQMKTKIPTWLVV